MPVSELRRAIAAGLNSPRMTPAVLLFAHSDGDGHLAAEQSRRNLIDAGMDVRLVVDPQTTRSWPLLDAASRWGGLR